MDIEDLRHLCRRALNAESINDLAYAMACVIDLLMDEAVESVPCTCGYGGQHEPSKLTCQRTIARNGG